MQRRRRKGVEVRVFAWRLLLAKNGAINWSLGKLHLPELGVAYSNTAMWIVFSYVWLPFMILPIYAALERIPHSYIEASRDLGGRGFRTFRSVILPLALPGVLAGSIFTFSLTLGDYKVPCAMDTPPFRTVLLRDPSGPGPLGAKAAGELTNTSVAPAVASVRSPPAVVTLRPRAANRRVPTWTSTSGSASRLSSQAGGESLPPFEPTTT